MIIHVIDRRTKKEERFETDATTVRIGRDEFADLRLAGSHVSRQHLLVLLEHGRLFVQPLGTNPTYTIVMRGEQRERIRLPQAEKISIPPGTQIDIDRYGIFIDLGLAGGVQERNNVRELADLEERVHQKLMDELNLRGAAISQAGDSIRHRVERTLESLIDQEMPTVLKDRELREHILAEALRSAIVLRLLSAGAGTAGRSGWAGRQQRVLDDVVAQFLRRMHATGAADTVNEDLVKFERYFRKAYKEFVEKADPRLCNQIVRGHLMRDLVNIVVGLGPLEDLVTLPGVSEIMVVDKDTIYVEKGKMERIPRSFLSNEVLMSVIERILAPVGRRVDTSTPMVDARLPDGSRVNAIIPPLAIRGPCLTIRKFGNVQLTGQTLVSNGTLSSEALTFLKACVVGKKNMLVSGGTGSGKTTLLNILSGFIPSDERIVTAEDAAELQFRQEHVVTLETKAPNQEGKGGYAIRDLVKNALRMRPDRIIVGECRSAEALDMLQAMNTGHEGSMTTAHANSPEDCLLRLEVMALQAAESITVQSLREQIVAALDLIVQIERQVDPDTGRIQRLCTSVTEVVGIDERDGTVRTREIMNRESGALGFTGYLPSFVDELVQAELLDLNTLFGVRRPAAS